MDVASNVVFEATKIYARADSTTSASPSSTSSASNEERPPIYKVIGIILAICSGLFIGVSFVLKKTGLLKANLKYHEEAGEGYGYLKNTFWWTGMTLMIIGEICNFVAYAFVDAILVTPLGALSVVVTTILSAIFLKERLSFVGKVGCFNCIIGSVVIVVNAPTQSSAATIQEMQHFVIAPGFLSYAGVIIVGCVFVALWVAPRYGKKSMLVYLTVCSLIGGLSVVSTQGLGAAIITQIRGTPQFNQWFLYVLLVFVITTLVTEIIYLNKALNIFNAALVTPTYYVYFTSSTIVTSAILFRGFKGTPIQIITMVMGFFQICAGVVLLQLSKSSKDVPDAAVFSGDLDQVRTVAEQEEPEYEPRADTIRGGGAIIRAISVSRNKKQMEEVKRIHEEHMEPIREGEQVEFDGLRRRKTILNPASPTPGIKRSKTIHPPLGMAQFPDEHDSTTSDDDVHPGFFPNLKKRAQAASWIPGHRHPSPVQLDSISSPTKERTGDSLRIPGHDHDIDTSYKSPGAHSITFASDIVSRTSSQGGGGAPTPPPHSAPPNKRQFSFQNVFARSRSGSKAPSDDGSIRPTSRGALSFAGGGSHSRKASKGAKDGSPGATEEERLGLVKGDSSVWPEGYDPYAKNDEPLPEYSEEDSESERAYTGVRGDGGEQSGRRHTRDDSGGSDSDFQKIGVKDYEGGGGSGSGSAGRGPGGASHLHLNPGFTPEALQSGRPHVLDKRMDDRAPPVLRQGRPWTFRLQNIPIGTSEERLVQYFIEQDRAGIEVRSLCTSVDEKTLTATISFVAPGNGPRQPKLIDADRPSKIGIDENFHGLTPLNTPEEPIVADIIAVTGLAGHAFGSWASSPFQMWLRDFLPYDLPNARVLTYGYYSQVQQASSRSIVGDHVRMFKQRVLTLPRSALTPHRPIIFIGHSLGCLLIKKALVEIISSSSASSIPDVPFIIFLGAPHRGLDNSALQTILGAGELSKDIVDELGESSPTLTDLNESFAKIAHQLNILSCYELCPTKTLIKDKDGFWKREGPPAMMVKQNSAMLHSANEIRLPCNADHSKIAKLERGEESIYPTLKGNIQYTLEKYLYTDPPSSNEQGSVLREPSRKVAPGPTPIIEAQAEPGASSVFVLPPSRNNSVSRFQSGRTPSPLGEQSAVSQMSRNGLPSPTTERILWEDSGRHAALPLPDTGSLFRGSNRSSCDTSQGSTAPMLSPSSEPMTATSTHENDSTGFPEEKQVITTPDTNKIGVRGQIDPDHSTNGTVHKTEERLHIGPEKPEMAFQGTPRDLSPRSRDSPDLPHISNDSRKMAPPSPKDRLPLTDEERASHVLSPNPSDNSDEMLSYRGKRNSRSSKFLSFFLHNTSPKQEKQNPYELLKAAADNDIGILQALKLRGADLESKTSQGGNRTALHEAATSNAYEVADYLIKEGAKKDAKSTNKSTPLHEAAFAGSTAVAQLLVLAGADLEAMNLGDETPLQLAAMRGHDEIAKILVYHGADINTTKSDGKTPLQVAQAKGHAKVCEILRAKGARLPRRNTKDEQAPQWPGLF
ncbi:MAG: hypothetical protein M1820_004091 [Bogoriella megaspora]|nr:MAG: hypothetical protein M1820_004091 [Bogoriella megaspora]